MPGGDRTGPLGHGPMTGRAAGFCAGYPEPGYVNAGFGQGRGRGFGYGRGRGGGRGMGFRHGQGRFYGYPGFAYGNPGPSYVGAGPSQDIELNMLQDQAKNLESTLENIKQRISDLEQEDESK